LGYLPPYTEKPRSAMKETATMNILLASSTTALSFIPRYIHMQNCPDVQPEVRSQSWKKVIYNPQLIEKKSNKLYTHRNFMDRKKAMSLLNDEKVRDEKT